VLGYHPRAAFADAAQKMQAALDEAEAGADREAAPAA
jgi:hypothetical protein